MEDILKIIKETPNNSELGIRLRRIKDSDSKLFELTKKYPNDMTLGEIARKFFTSKQQMV